MHYLDNCTLNPLHRVLVETPTHRLQVGEGNPQPSYQQMTATSQGRPGIVLGCSPPQVEDCVLSCLRNSSTLEGFPDKRQAIRRSCYPGGGIVLG